MKRENKSLDKGKKKKVANLDKHPKPGQILKTHNP
jgi:hypothetical protein